MNADLLVQDDEEREGMLPAEDTTAEEGGLTPTPGNGGSTAQRVATR